MYIPLFSDTPPDVLLISLAVTLFLMWGFSKLRSPRREPREEPRKDATWYLAEKQRLDALAEYEMSAAHLEEQRRFFKENMRR